MSRVDSSLDDLAVENFREYIRIPSVHPNVDYSDCVTFLKKQASSLELPINVIEIVQGKPIVIITWEGTNPELKSILLNSHMDVVPVYPEDWTHDPFGAEIDESGNIYGRGTQDMKSVGIQYLEAIRRLKLNGVSLKRTLHMSFVPDEEIGGEDGMKVFVKTPQFEALNVGFALDEGMASPTEAFSLYNGERSLWHVQLKCNGQAGHGSLLLPNTAGGKVRYLIDKFLDRRQEELDKLNSDPELTVGDVTTINLTVLEGGVQPNVVPPEMTITFDCRLSVNVIHEEFEAEIRKWMEEAGGDIELTFLQKNPQIGTTPLDDTNTYWLAMKQVFDKLDVTIKPRIFPAATDSRYIRKIGLPALGFSPMNNTPVLLHDNDEFLNRDVFLKGITIYESLLPAVANVDN